MRAAIVDDSPMVRAMLSHHLKSFGYDPFEINPTAVFDVMRSLREFEAGLAIVDLQMPACPGLSLIRAIREDPALANLPILVYTAHLDDEAAACLQGMKVNAVAPKPMNPKELESQIAQALQGTAWCPSGLRSQIILIDEIDARRRHLQELLQQAGHPTRGLEPDSCFDLMGSLLKAPPALLVISLGWDACPALSLIRLVREDPRLSQVPILAFGRPSHGIPPELLDQFEVEVLHEAHTPGRLLESIQDLLEVSEAPEGLA